MRETFRIMCEDGGWKDGVAMLLGTVTSAVGTMLMIALFGGVR